MGWVQRVGLLLFLLVANLVTWLFFFPNNLVVLSEAAIGGVACSFAIAASNRAFKAKNLRRLALATGAWILGSTAFSTSIILFGNSTLWPWYSTYVDVIGSNSEANNTCTLRDLEILGNGKNMVAVARLATCAGATVVDVPYIFGVVFVHGNSVANSRGNLVLQYTIPQCKDEAPCTDRDLAPTVRWVGTMHLVISIPTIVDQLVICKRHFAGLDIEYVFRNGSPRVNPDLPPYIKEIR